VAPYIEFESEVPSAEEMLDRVICSREQFSLQMSLESGDGIGTFCNWRQRVPDSWCHDTRVATGPVFAGTSCFSACLSRVPVEHLPGRYMSRFLSIITRPIAFLVKKT